MIDWILLFLGIFLTIGTAVFVGGEFSLVALDPPVVEKATKTDHSRSLGYVEKSLHTLSTQLSGAQVGITLTTILLGYTSQPAMSRLLARWLGETSWMSSGLAVFIAGFGSFVVVNAFSMLFGELVPKNAALADPLKTAKLAAPAQHVFTAFFKPLIVLLNGSANAVLRLWGIEPKEELSGARSAHELASLVRRSAELGTLDEQLAKRLTKSLALVDLTAVDIMTDRTRMVTVHRDDSVSVVVEGSRRTGHSRFPVIEESADDIVGFVHLKRAIGVPYDRRGQVPVSAVMSEAARVPETASLDPLLVQLRDTELQIAVVVDEYGGTSGIVTLEDVIEEIVGDVADEHDRRRADVRRVASGAWSVPGVMRPDELAERCSIQVPDAGAYETLGGLVMQQLGRIPRTGDIVEVNGVRILVDRMDERRIDRLRVWPAPPVEEA